jgi:hypothetical protein
MNFFYTGLNKKYIEYAQFCLEEKEKDFILDINNENKLTGIEINEKTNKIKQTIESSNKNMNKNFLSENDYNLFHDFAVSKGGFLNMKFRKEIYKKLLYYSNIPLNNISNIKLKVNSNNQNNNNNSQINSSTNKLPINIIQNNPNNNNNNNNTYFLGPYYMPQIRYFRNVWINKSTQKIYWSHDYLYQYLKPLKERQTIKVDVERCNINSYFPSNSFPYLNSFLKSKVESALNAIITFNKNEFKYYQGYHDIFMLFFYLYMDSPYTYISLFQRFSELYIKDNLSISDKNNGKGFNFPNCIKLCMVIIQELNNLAYNELVEYCKSDCTFVMPYIICLFTHNINNIFIKYRLLDYFLVSHPISVYVMTSLIVIDEITKIKTQYNMDKLKINTYNFFNSENKNQIGALNESNFFTHFQKLNFDEIDFEKYIQKTEESLQNFNFDKIYNEFIGPNYGFKPYYPVICKEKYLKNLIKYDFEKGNDGGYNPLANLLFNSRFAKFVIEKSNKLYKEANDKITNSRAYKAYNKIFPFAFFCSSILIIPSFYIANYQSK